MNARLFLYAAALLSLERLCYVWICRRPRAFMTACGTPAIVHLGQPVDALRWLFYGFKALQIGVFVAWCWVHGHGSLWPAGGGTLPTTIGAVSVAVGQTLNLSVFRRLGNRGVFYGNLLGHSVPRCEGFPFSLLKHPQYVGTVLSIWGAFLIMRFPHGDWCVLPVLETIYYAVGAHFET